MRFEDRGELSTAVICLFDSNATAETAERTEGGRAAMFVEMPPKGTQRRRRGQCRPRPVMHQMRGQGKVPQNAREEKSCVAHELSIDATHFNGNMGYVKSHAVVELKN